MGTESPLIEFKFAFVICGAFMAFQIFFYNFFRNISCTTSSIADAPQMFAPVAFSQGRMLAYVNIKKTK
jgi:tellurite resistance protein TehA-like permease